jgi:hypothetical protein
LAAAGLVEAVTPHADPHGVPAKVKLTVLV